MLISTFSNFDITKIKASIVAEGAKSIGDICISYGTTNSLYLTFDEVIALVNQLDELIGRNLP